MALCRLWAVEVEKEPSILSAAIQHSLLVQLFLLSIQGNGFYVQEMVWASEPDLFICSCSHTSNRIDCYCITGDLLSNSSACEDDQSIRHCTLS